ncbi:putative reverse transcriptase domain-containing protein [Tanacetum coccineum]
MLFPRLICRLERGLVLLIHLIGLRSESLAATISRHTRSTLARGIDYGFIDTLDASIRATDERVMISLKEVNERMTDIVSTHRHGSEDFYTRHQDVQDERALLHAQISTLRRERRYHCHTAMISESEAMYARQASSQAMNCNRAEREAISLPYGYDFRERGYRIDYVYTLTSHIQHEHGIFKALEMQSARMDQLMPVVGVGDALAAYEANRGSGNRYDSHDLGSSGRRPVPTARIEYVFHISSCTVGNQVKYATCTLLGSALIWWNSHVKTVSHDAAYGMPWKTLIKMLTDKYYPRSEIKKLEIELLNLKVKGTNIVSYTQHFQELALMCGRMLPEESDQVEKYVGRLPDMIQGSVMASKLKTMQEAVEFANDLMDQKIRTFAKRQAENKRKLENNPRDNQAQQQTFKRQNIAKAYTARPGKKKEYGGTLPLCTKCNYYLIRQQDGQQDPPQGPPYPLPDWSQQCSLVIGL